MSNEGDISTFESENVINTHISESNLRAFFVGYDIEGFRYEKLCEYIVSALVDFCFGYHEGIKKTYTTNDVREAAKSLYSIKINDKDKNPIAIFEKAKDTYLDDREFDDDEKFLKRGEFGELIMHLLLRDFLNTIPLLSKIYLKDSDGATVHGFDAVHVGPSVAEETDGDSLYLGESKLYINPKRGITELITDIENHFTTDYLNREFALISKKKNSFTPESEVGDEEYGDFLKKKNEWFKKFDDIKRGSLKTKDLFTSVTIPLLCTYTSEIFDRHSDESTEDFKNELNSEIEDLRNNFETKLNNLKQKIEKSGLNIATDLNVVLILFPVPSKKELVKRLHARLSSAQNI